MPGKHGLGRFSRIIWAVDPFIKDAKLQSRAAEAIRALTHGISAVVQPVYVLRPPHLNLSIEFYPDWIEQYRAASEKAFAQFLGAVELPGVLPPKILVNDSSSMREASDALTSYALKERFELIVVSTHASSGVSRLLVGSFAETLVLYTKVPVLVVNPATGPITKIEHILFPTDFSEPSKEAFETVTALAAAIKSELTVYHKREAVEPAAPAAQQAEKLQADELADSAEKRGINAHVVIEPSSGNTAQAILDYAARHCGGHSMIALAAQSGPVATLLLGSVARQVIRGATCPVWLIRPLP